MTKHVASGAYRVVAPSFAHVINPLQCEPKKGTDKLRLCMDARYPNYFMPYVQFKLETLTRDVAPLIMPHDLLFTIDLESAYYYVPVRPCDWKYLCWRHDGKCYTSTVLPFGVGTAPMVFTKVVKEMVKFMRMCGIRVVNYIDDFIFVVAPHMADATVTFVKWLFARLGWHVNAKSMMTPSHRVDFLGIIVDAQRAMFEVPHDKAHVALLRVKVMMSNAKRGKKLSTHDLLVLAGKLGAMSVAVQCTLAWTREMITLAEGGRSVEYVDATPLLLDELKYWANVLPHTDKLRRAFVARVEHHTILNVDSGDASWGAHTATREIHGYLPIGSVGQSSTHRELMGLQQACHELTDELKGRSILVRMDSHASIRNLMKEGSMKCDLASITRKWYTWCHDNNVAPSFEWVRREKNERADALSRIYTEKWCVNATIYGRIRNKWGDIHVMNPEWGQITNKITDFENDRTHREVALITPEWMGMSWWSRLHKYTIDAMPQIPFDELYISRARMRQPGWLYRVWRIRR
jgi:hypothetical protein